MRNDPNIDKPTKREVVPKRGETRSKQCVFSKKTATQGRGLKIANKQNEKTKMESQDCEQRKVVLNWPQYDKIKENQLVSPVEFVNVDEEIDCECSPLDHNACGPRSKCSNFAMSIECGTNCPAREKCQNQRFNKRIYKKLQLREFNSKGWGLLVQEDIEKDTFIIEYVGEIIDTNEFNRRFEHSVARKVDHFYFSKLENGLYIDSSVRGN